MTNQHDNAKNSHHILDRYNNYYVFGFVRNPWDRLASWFSLLNNTNNKNSVKIQCDFERFLNELVQPEYKIDNSFHLNQLDYFTDNKNVMRAHKIARFENYEQEITEIFKHIGIEPVPIPKLNSASAINYKNLYTKKTINWVADYCSRDIDFWDYSF